MGKVVLYGSVSVDGYIEQDQPGPLFDWRTNGDVALGADGQLRVAQSSYDYTQSYWDRIGMTIAGRRVFDLTDGWGGAPPSGVDHMVIVPRRPPPEGWGPRGSFFFADGVEAAVASAQDLARDRIVEVAPVTSVDRHSLPASSMRCGWILPPLRSGQVTAFSAASTLCTPSAIPGGYRQGSTPRAL